jgi:hypothetical protein
VIPIQRLQCRASGDHVDFPTSTHVLGGGTELIAANGAIQREIAWNG